MLLGVFAAGTAQAGLTWSGGLRNDLMLWNHGDRTQAIDLLENQWVLQQASSQWKFYADLRLDVYGGDLSGLLPAGDTAAAQVIQARVLRSFVRYYSDVGDFTAGKTYVNLGIANLFNPFELDRAYNVTDLNYARDGILALTYEAAFSDVSGIKAYVRPVQSAGAVTGGADARFHLGTFDAGIVAQRLGRDDNVVGGYAKGDAEAGLQGAFAVHVDDGGGWKYAQANAGVDYSFGEGKWIVTLLGYYNGNADGGPENTADLDLPNGTSFSSRYYAYADVLYLFDEFFQARFSALVNCSDGSALLIPSATWVLADGLNANLQALAPTGAGTDQFSSALLGRVIGLVRVEAKF